MKFLNFLLLLLIIFALLDLDLDSEYGSGSTDLIESGSGSETLILGKIKRSNSGGFECERRAPSGQSGGSLSLAAGTSGTNGGSDAVFKRGGTRATASGRLGWSSQTNGGGVGAAVFAAAASNLNRKRFSEWSVDMLCHWLETIGLGQVKYEYLPVPIYF